MKSNSIFEAVDCSAVPELLKLDNQIMAHKFPNSFSFDFLQLDFPWNKNPWFPIQDFDLVDNFNELSEPKEGFSWLLKKLNGEARNLFWFLPSHFLESNNNSKLKCMKYSGTVLDRENLDDVYWSFVKSHGIFTDLKELMIVNFSSDFVYFHMPFDWYPQFFGMPADEYYAGCEDIFTLRDYTRFTGHPELVDFFLRVNAQWENALKVHFPNSPFLRGLLT
jgi:hypothetical protein